MTPEYLNSLIASYAASPPAIDWPIPLVWCPCPDRPGWLTASIPSAVGTYGAYELGRCAFKRAGLDYLMTEERGIATAIHVGRPGSYP